MHFCGVLKQPGNLFLGVIDAPLASLGRGFDASEKMPGPPLVRLQYDGGLWSQRGQPGLQAEA